MALPTQSDNIAAAVEKGKTDTVDAHDLALFAQLDDLAPNGYLQAKRKHNSHYFFFSATHVGILKVFSLACHQVLVDSADWQVAPLDAARFLSLSLRTVPVEEVDPAVRNKRFNRFINILPATRTVSPLSHNLKEKKKIWKRRRKIDAFPCCHFPLLSCLSLSSARATGADCRPATQRLHQRQLRGGVGRRSSRVHLHARPATHHRPCTFLNPFNCHLWHAFFLIAEHALQSQSSILSRKKTNSISSSSSSSSFSWLLCRRFSRFLFPTFFFPGRRSGGWCGSMMCGRW
jgi:hypothetical protein